jgi:hypothetical protein
MGERRLHPQLLPDLPPTVAASPLLAQGGVGVYEGLVAGTVLQQLIDESIRSYATAADQGSNAPQSRGEPWRDSAAALPHKFGRPGATSLLPVGLGSSVPRARHRPESESDRIDRHLQLLRSARRFPRPAPRHRDLRRGRDHSAASGWSRLPRRRRAVRLPGAPSRSSIRDSQDAQRGSIRGPARGGANHSAAGRRDSPLRPPDKAESASHYVRVVLPGATR